MFGDHDDTHESDALNKVENNDGDITHDLLAGAAAAVAMREWQQKQETDGKPQTYDDAKTVMAGLATAAVTHLIETKGMDQFDSYKAKHDAAEQAKKALSQSGIYGQQEYETRAYDKDNDNDRTGNNSTYGSGLGGRDGNDGNEGYNRGSAGYDNRNQDNDNRNYNENRGVSDTGYNNRENDDINRGSSGYNNRRDNDDDNNNERRAEGYGNTGSNQYGAGEAGQNGPGGNLGARRDDGENEFGRNNEGENKKYYDREAQGSEGFSGRDKDENEYGSENRREGYGGNRSDDY